MNLFRPEPGGALWLLRNELRLFWRKGDKKTSLRAVLVAVAVGWLGFSWLIFRPLSEVVPGLSVFLDSIKKMATAIAEIVKMVIIVLRFIILTKTY